MTGAISMSLMLRPPPVDYVDGEFREIKHITVKSSDIETPVYNGQFKFHEGGVYKFRQYMEKKKTVTMIAYCLYLLEERGYYGFEVYANAWLDIPGAHWLSNEEFKKLCRRAFNIETTKRRWAHTIWMAFDADEIWSYVTQADKQCFEDLMKLPKCYKRNIHFLYETHEGKGVPKPLRNWTEISIKPFPDDAHDRVKLLVCDGHHGVNSIVPVDHISRIFQKYDRFGDDEE